MKTILTIECEDNDLMDFLDTILPKIKQGYTSGIEGNDIWGIEKVSK